MIMKISVVVKEVSSGQIIYTEDYFVKNKSEIPLISKKVSDRLIELENKYEYPTYEVEQLLSWVPEENIDNS